MNDIDSNVADINRLLKVHKTFDAESQTAKVLDAEIDRLADAIDAEAESEARIASTSQCDAVSIWADRCIKTFGHDDDHWAFGYTWDSSYPAPALDGAMTLTAEQVEDVRRVVNCSLQYGNIASREAAARLDSSLPKTEPAWKKCGSASTERVCQRLLGHPGNHLHYSHSRHAWRSWPADPAEDRLDIGTADAESLTGWEGSTPAESTEDEPTEVRQHPRLWYVQATGRPGVGNSSAYVDIEERANYYAKLFLDTGYMAVSIHPPVMDPFIEIATERPV